MATPGPRDPGSHDPTSQVVVRTRRDQHLKMVRDLSARQRRRLAPIGIQASGPVVSATVSEKVVLQADFVNIVTTPTVGFVEIEITIDTDGRMRFWGGGGSGGGGSSGGSDVDMGDRLDGSSFVDLGDRI